MFRVSRPAVLTATMTLAAGLFAAPGAAYAADTTTSLSQAQMAAELRTVADTSSAAAADGWKATLTATVEVSVSVLYVVDPRHGTALAQLRAGGVVDEEYAVAGKGTYQSLTDRASLSAVKMMRRPAVRYAFTAQPTLKLAAYVDDNAPTPADVLTEDITAGTKTRHDDGSTDYTFHDGSGTVTMLVGPAGTLTGARAVDRTVTATLAYTYGPQTLTAPAPSVTIGAAALEQGIAYLDMATSVKSVADQGAADTRRAARGRTVKVAALRKTLRRDAAAFNARTRVKMVKVTDVRGGVRVHATNPWTGRSVSYTVKASGRKITVRG